MTTSDRAPDFSSTTRCALCTFVALPSNDAEMFTQGARALIQGLLSSLRDRGGAVKNFRPLRRLGISVVERCAQRVETPCNHCGASDCPRCAISAELRASEESIHAERDDELAALGADGQDVEETLDMIVDGLCAEHVAFGPVLLGEWYKSRSFATAPPLSSPADR